MTIKEYLQKQCLRFAPNLRQRPPSWIKSQITVKESKTGSIERNTLKKEILVVFLHRQIQKH